MMEFTVSRCILMVCGILLLGAVAEPVAEHFSDREDSMLDDLAQKDAALVDSFDSSGLDECILDGSLLMPDDSYRVEIDGHRLSLIDDDGMEHTAYLQKYHERTTLGYQDRVVFGHVPEDNDGDF